MTLTLIIARHGNTFGVGQEPRRVGLKTDIPLVSKGRAQAKALGRTLAELELNPVRVFCSRLKRSRETAAIVVRVAGWGLPLRALRLFDEIDYGPDENKPESSVLERVGASALRAWENHAIPAPSWKCDPKALRRRWITFAHGLGEGLFLIVTSNGIARFAPGAQGKLATGALGIVQKDQEGLWHTPVWNFLP